MALQTDEYTVRQYEPADRSEILSLYEQSFGSRSSAWFDWRYVDNPYLPAVPIHVAEHDDQVVGARLSLPIPLSAGNTRVLALMQVDPMVHPDHRRQGLFVRMAARVHERYESGPPTVELGFPNESALSALETLESELSLHAGVRYPFAEWFRIQHLDAMVADSTDDSRLRLLARLGAPVARGYLRVREAQAPTPTGFEVECIDGVPAERLSSLATDDPRTVHVARDEEFYRWRFANPRYDYRTYVASKHGTATVAVVVGEPAVGGAHAHVANISEVVPIQGGPERDAGIAAVLATVTAETNADGLAAGGAGLDASLLDAYGFRPRRSFPLSVLSDRNYVLARPLVEEPVEEWVVGGCRLSDPDRWRLSYCEREIG